jgi:hypothetical protein
LVDQAETSPNGEYATFWKSGIFSKDEIQSFRASELQSFSFRASELQSFRASELQSFRAPV